MAEASELGLKNENTIPDQPHAIPGESASSSRKGWRFWAVFPPLCLSQLLIALETSIPTASLPKISADLAAGDNWVWIVNAYLLTKYEKLSYSLSPAAMWKSPRLESIESIGSCLE